MEALKASTSKVVGTRQVLRAIRNGGLKCVYVAEDADTFLFQRITQSAENAGIAVKRVRTMATAGMRADCHAGTRGTVWGREVGG